MKNIYSTTDRQDDKLDVDVSFGPRPIMISAYDHTDQRWSSVLLTKDQVKDLIVALAKGLAEVEDWV